MYSMKIFTLAEIEAILDALKRLKANDTSHPIDLQELIAKVEA